MVGQNKAAIQGASGGKQRAAMFHRFLGDLR